MDIERDDIISAGSKIYNDGHLAIEVPETAQQISTDSWFQAGFVLTTGINSAYVLGYSGAVMVPLGWVGGVVGLILATVISLYANVVIAELHEFGRKRHIRYRDLAGFFYGPKVYSLTWMLQYVNLFMINVGLIMLAGQALKEFKLHQGTIVFQEHMQAKSLRPSVLLQVLCLRSTLECFQKSKQQ